MEAALTLRREVVLILWMLNLPHLTDLLSDSNPRPTSSCASSCGGGEHCDPSHRCVGGRRECGTSSDCALLYIDRRECVEEGSTASCSPRGEYVNCSSLGRFSLATRTCVIAGDSRALEGFPFKCPFQTFACLTPTA